MCEKSTDEKELEDTDLFANKYPNHWGKLFDKGYQVAVEMVHAIYSTKNHQYVCLFWNRKLKTSVYSADRIIVVNFFGRFCTLWDRLGAKYRWNENLYDDIFKLGLALTNFHMKFHALRAEDGEYYRKYKARMGQIGNKIQLK